MVASTQDCNPSSGVFNRVLRILVSCEVEIMTVNEGVWRYLVEHESVFVRCNLVDLFPC